LENDQPLLVKGMG